MNESEYLSELTLEKVKLFAVVKSSDCESSHNCQRAKHLENLHILRVENQHNYYQHSEQEEEIIAPAEIAAFHSRHFDSLINLLPYTSFKSGEIGFLGFEI